MYISLPRSCTHVYEGKWAARKGVWFIIIIIIIIIISLYIAQKFSTAVLGEQRETMWWGLLSYTTLYTRKETVK